MSDNQNFLRVSWFKKAFWDAFLCFCYKTLSISVQIYCIDLILLKTLIASCISFHFKSFNVWTLSIQQQSNWIKRKQGKCSLYSKYSIQSDIAAHIMNKVRNFTFCMMNESFTNWTAVNCFIVCSRQCAYRRSLYATKSI